MTNSQEERRIRGLFAALKQEDIRRAPSFNRVWRAAQRQTRRARRSKLVLRYAAAVACSALVVASGFIIGRQALRQQDRATPRSLAEWRSPTASLLRFPGKAVSKAAEQPDLFPNSTIPGSGGRPPRTYFLKTHRNGEI